MALRQLTFPVGVLACNCTILADEASATAMVIDPGAEVEGIIALLERHHWRLEAICITHAHIDHIGGAAELKRRTGAPVWLNPRDVGLSRTLDMQAQWLGIAPPPLAVPDAALDASARLQLGGETIQVLETPGHTEGSVCLYLAAENKLFAGDTLFAGSVGRTDLPGGSSEALLRSLHSVVLALPDQTVVVPGHGPETTLARERATNPFLRQS